MNHRWAGIFLVMAMLAVVMSCRRPEDAAQRATTAASRPGSGDALRTAGAPTPESLTRLLGVQVDEAPGEVNQYLIRSGQGSADLAKVGKIHQDLGYAVGVTLSNGIQIGFRYEALSDPPAEAPAAGVEKN